MAATIFLHIGTNKTGTTAIQRFFNTQRDALKKHGVLYPTTACKGTAHHALGIALGFGHDKKRTIGTQKAELQVLKKALKTEIEQSAPHTVLISAENFFGVPNSIEPVKAFFSDFDVRIVVYLRRHDYWWESAYNQSVKMVKKPAWNPGLEAYIRYSQKQHSNFGCYRTLVEQWTNVFGQSNIIVRPYEQQQNQPNIITDFLSAIGQAPLAQQFNIQPDRPNESLPFFTLSLIDIYKRANVDPEIRANLIKHAMSLAGNDERSSMCSPALRRRLVDENMQDYQYIAREYLGRTDGQLFYDPLPDPNEPWLPPKQPTMVNLVEQVVQTMSSQPKKSWWSLINAKNR